MPIGPNDVPTQSFEEIIARYIKNIDHFLLQGKLRRSKNGAVSLHLTDVRKTTSDILPRTNVEMRQRLEKMYENAGWKKVMFYSGGEVFFYKEYEKRKTKSSENI